MNRFAIFSDETNNYVSPTEVGKNETVVIRIQTAKEDMDKVFLIYDYNQLEMQKVRTNILFDYYEAEINSGDDKINYYFQLIAGDEICFFHKKGVSNEPNYYHSFNIIPGFKTPNWAKGAVIYQIFVDRFYDGDKTNNVVDGEYIYLGRLATYSKDWCKIPSVSNNEFYGGDLLGILKKLDYLKDLGIDAIYLNPIFVSPSNHKYDTQDYDYVDPHYGEIVDDGGEVLVNEYQSNEQATKYIKRVTSKKNLLASNKVLIKLVEEAHKKNIKVILDGVFNHCGSFHKWLDREKIYINEKGYDAPAYLNKNSPYDSYFKFYQVDGRPINSCYDGWWGHETLPKLNYENSPVLQQYILNIVKKWLEKPYNLDGWRLDVAADLGFSRNFNHTFWKHFRKVVKSVNKDAIIIAEHYGDPSEWLQGDQWDTVMNYDAFMEPVSWFLTGTEKHSDEFRNDLLNNHHAFINTMIENMSKYSIQSLQVAMNELSNHDHSRFLTRTNHKVGRINTLGVKAASEDINKGIMKEAIVIQMTFVGAPTIYYGDEAGLCGWTDPDNRRTYPWGKEDQELIKIHKIMIKMRKEYKALKTGSFKFLYGDYGVIAYGRWDNNNKLVIAVNNTSDEKQLTIPVWEIGITNEEKIQRLIMTTYDSINVKKQILDVKENNVKVILPLYSSVVFKAIQ